jgi:Fe-S oxidoreductase
MSYLLDLFKAGKLKPVKNPISRGFVYHQPCHLAAVGDRQASVKLLKELCGIEVVELKAGCCGIAGTFGMQKKNYELSSQIAARLKEAMEKSPIKNVLTECAACKMQIEHISECVVRHPVKVLSKSYKDG